MIHLVCTSFTEPLPEPLWQRYMQHIPQELHASITRYHRWQDQTSSLIGKLLILKALSLFSGNNLRLSDIQYTEYKRPYLPWAGDFNLSHSGEWVVCAATDRGRVGVDIESIRTVDFTEFSSCFTPNEWDRIRTSSEPLETFFTHWSAKESVIKADGRGMYAPLQSIQTQPGQATTDKGPWFLQQKNIAPGYSCHIASNEPITELTIAEIPLDSLVD